MGEILKRVLAIAGIYTDKDPILTIWTGGRKMTIKTFDLALRFLLGGIRGTYIVTVENPTFVGIDPKPFKINYIDIVCEYDRDKGWCEPSIVTDEEEYDPDTTLEQLANRAKRVVGKAKEIMELFSALRTIAKILGYPVP